MISDVDDTIKKTGVTVGRTHLKNLPWLLLDPIRPWRPIPGMARLYQGFRKNLDASFLYVSKGPPFSRDRLEQGLMRYQFPAGRIRLDDKFPSAAANYKFATISPVISQSKGARYILIGDSGEADPENYGMLARKYPKAIDRIFIRSVTTDSEERYHVAFRNIPRSKWKVFVLPEEIKYLQRRL
ncbi:MAG: DUF2183 domain-containing protein [Chthoniobacter sp.]|nr:DUF2183 domain-containing protein [Chthoniobacter sp.]